MRLFQPTLIAATLFATASFAAPAEPTFSKVVAPDVVEVGNPTVVTYTIGKTGIADDLADLAFSETLPAGVEVSAYPDHQSTCEGGTFTAVAGTGTIGYSGGALTSESCTLTVNVTPTTSAPHTLTSGVLSYTANGTPGSSTSSTDDLSSSATTTAITKSINFTSIDVGATARAEVGFTINQFAFNTFTETLPAGLRVADPIQFTTTCALGMSAAVAADRQSFVTSYSRSAIGDETCVYGFDVEAVLAGSHLSSTTVAGSTSARATAQIDVSGFDGASPSLVSAVANSPVPISGLAEFTYTIFNPDRSEAASGMSFTVDYNAIIAGATVESTSSATPCGVGSTGSGSSIFTLSGGNLASGETCEFTVNVRLPNTAVADDYTFDTSTLTGDLGGTGFTTATSTANLSVSALAPLQLSATGVPSSTAPEETVTVEYTLTNPNASDALTGVVFKDFSYLMASETISLTTNANTCGGYYFREDAAAGDPSDYIYYLGGSIAAGASCIVTIEATLPADFLAGDFTSSVEGIYSLVGGSALPTPDTSYNVSVQAAGNLHINKNFDPEQAVPGQAVKVDYVLRNVDEANAVNLVTFTDDFEAFNTGTTLSSIDINSCGLVITDPSGSPSLVGFNAVSIAAGGYCDISLTVVLGAGTGTFTSTTSEIAVNGVGIAGTEASADLTVATVLPLIGEISFPDSPTATFVAGAEVRVQFSIENLNDAAASLALSSVASSAISGATFATSPIVDTCDGTPASSSSVSYSGGSIAAFGTCVLEYMMLVPGGAPAASSTLLADITSDAGNSDASGSLTIDTNFLTTTAALTSDAIIAGGDFSYTYTLTNSYFSDATNGSFVIDASALLGIPVTITPTGCLLTFSGLATYMFTANNVTVVAGDTCTVEIRNSSAAPASGITLGSYELPTTTAQAEVDGVTLSAPDASATLQVNAVDGPALTVAFGADPYVSETIDVTYSLTNGSVAAADMRFLHDLSTLGLGLTASSLPSTPCGAGSTISGTDTLLVENMNLAGGASCEFTVTLDVPITATAGSYNSTTGDITVSGAVVAAGATDSFDVLAAPAAAFSASTSPSTIMQAEVSTVTYLIDGSASPIASTGLQFSHAMPSGLEIATPSNASTTCTGGTLTAVGDDSPSLGEASAANYVSYTGGSLAANSSCTVSVDVTSTTVTTFNSDTSALISNLGTSTAATVNLVVLAQTQGTVTLVQDTNTDGDFTFSSATTELDFLITTTGGTGAQGPISVTNGTHIVTQSTPATMSTSSITCDDANSTGDAGTGVLTLNVEVFEHVTCTFTSGTTSTKATETISTFLKQRNSLILANQPSSSRRIGRLKRGTAAQRLSYSPGDVANLSPVTFDPMSYKSGTYDLSTSLDQVTRAAETFALATGGVGDTNYHRSSKFDIWFEASYNRFEGSSDNSGSFGIYYLGADYLVNPDLLIGALVQYDEMDSASVSDDYSIEGTGWMVGPYVTARLRENLYLDARFAWGQSDNDISPYNTYTDNFTTQRRLVNASLSGEFAVSDWTLQPNVELSYIEDSQKAYVDSLAVTVPNQKLSVGQLRFGPNASRQYLMSNGTIYQPRVTLDAIYSHERAVLGGVTTQDNYWRARLEAGLGIKTDDGLHMSLNGNLDGLGQSDFTAWGLDFVLGYEF
jgi:hypothetical protein